MWNTCVQFLKSPVCPLHDSGTTMTDSAKAASLARSGTTLQVESFDSYDFTKAKQQASVLWLMSKAYNNDIPNNLMEPYYCDHEGQDQLKPHIVHALANAELYCLALGNIYADQNHHSLNHNGVMMLLQRKGVYVVEPADISLTETVLVQVAPIRMTAHMAVIEAVMALYIKEVLIPDKIVQCVRKFCSIPLGTNLPADPEDAMVFWINKSCDKMKLTIQQEIESPDNTNQGKESTRPPHIPVIQDLSDLSDGCCLALLLSFYSPDHFSWRDICLNETLNLADSLYNLQLVLKFCEEVLPFNFYFLSLEDVLYMHSSIRQNILAFLADMFYVLEVKPAKCVKPSGLKDHKLHIPTSRLKISSGTGQTPTAAGIHSSKQIPSPIPDLRNTNHTYEFSYTSPKSPVQKDGSLPRNKHRYYSPYEGQKSPSSPNTGHPLRNDNRRHISDSPFYNGDHRLMKEDGTYYDKDSPLDSVPAAGIRSLSKRGDDSLILARLKVSKEKNHKESKVEERGESPDKPKNSGVIGEADIVLTSITGSPRRAVPNNAPMASNLTGIPGFQSPSAEAYERSFRDMPPEKQNSSLDRQAGYEFKDTSISTNFNTYNKYKEANSESSINLGYMPENSSPQKSNLVKKDSEKADSPKPQKKTSFAAMPSNTTTWQQQFANSQLESEEQEKPSGVDSDAALTSQLNNIRMELEEKRRNIELEKKKVDMMWNKQRQQVGKAAFLQAVTKNNDKSKMEGQNKSNQQDSVNDAKNVARNSDENNPQTITNVATPDSERMKHEDFHSSIGQLNDSLSGLQVDISKLSKQQEMIQHMVNNQKEEESLKQPQNFYLHNQQQQVTPPSNPIQGLMKSATMPQMKPTAHQSPVMSQQMDPHHQMNQQQQQQPMMMPHAPAGHHSMPPHMIHQPEHSMSQYPPQRNQWTSRPMTQDLSAPASRRGQWNQPTHQSMVDTSPQRQPWYMPPRQANPPIMSTGQYPMPYNPGYLPPDQHPTPYTLYQNGQGDNPHSQYSYSGPPYHPSQPSMYPPYTSQPMTNLPYHQPQSVPFRLHDQPNALPQNSIPPGNVSQHNVNQMTPPASVPQASLHSNTSQYQPVESKTPDNVAPNMNSENNQKPNQPPSRALGKTSEAVPQLPSSPKPENKYELGKTFRVPKPRVVSPTSKQPIARPETSDDDDLPELPTEPIKDGIDNDLGFFVSFDKQPVKPKPKFRAKSAGQMKTSPPSSVKEETNPKYNPNPFRSSSTVADKSSPLHHINDQNIKSATSSSSSVPDVVSSPIPHDDSATSNDNEENEEMMSGVGFIIGADLVNPDPIAEDEMARRKEKIMMISLHRKAKQEARRSFREREQAKQREEERIKKEMLERKKEEEKLRRQMIFEQYKQRKQAEAEETEGIRGPEPGPPPNSTRTFTKPRARSAKPRPKSQFVAAGGSNHDYPPPTSMSSRGSMRGSQPNLSVFGENACDERDGESHVPSRRALSPPPGSSLPGGYYGRQGPPSEASDTCSTGSVLDYAGPRLFVKPASKSNRGIVLNAVNTVLAGYVNADAKRHVLDEINKSESKHFLILFRDEGLKFRSMYSYNPEREEVFKLYGTGPKQVTEKMMDKFFKYNSGTKSFTEIHTKHLTVTIDAITIQNSLWQGKSIKKIPPRRDYL